MAYVSLYRKYRPDTFDKVIGQDHIVRTLKNQLSSGNVGHAYLFTGTRGTGKTSVAKIFAKAVNCLHPVDSSPCGECENCKALSSPTNFDIIEMDAASNNSVDQVRELIDKVAFPPTVGRYKVYILDEVHMLTTQAFNALLKTLEEPPAHVIFILATTEVHKIPSTILSRCLRFDFRLVPIPVIADRIKFIFDDIGVKYEDSAVKLIAASGAGSVRDALSVADTCVSFCNGNVTYGGALEVLGASDPTKIRALATAIADGNADEALLQASKLMDLGKSVTILAKDLAEFFRNALYIKNCASARQLLSLPDDVFDGIKAVADKYPTQRMLSIMKTFTSLEGELRYSTQHRIIFEGALCDACCGDATKTEDLQARLARLEKMLQTSRRSDFNFPPAVTDAKQVWVRVASKLSESNHSMLAIAVKDCKMEMTDSEFIITVSDGATLKLLEEKSNRDALNAAFAAVEQTGGRSLRLESGVHLDDDKALPYIREMFGNFLEVK